MATVTLPVAVPADDVPTGESRDGPDVSAVTAIASRAEVLRHRDLAELSAAERAEISRLLAALRPSGLGPPDPSPAARPPR